MNLPEELDFEPLSFEEKYHRAVPGYMKRIRDLYEAIHDRFGEEGLELIREVSRNYGTRIAMNVKKKRELKGVTQVGKYLCKVFDMVGGEWEIGEFTDKKLVITVKRCPYPFTRDVVCKAHTCMEQALVTTLDEELEYCIGKSIPQGDACCEHILRRRNGMV